MLDPINLFFYFKDTKIKKKIADEIEKTLKHELNLNDEESYKEILDFINNKIKDACFNDLKEKKDSKFKGKILKINYPLIFTWKNDDENLIKIRNLFSIKKLIYNFYFEHPRHLVFDHILR